MTLAKVILADDGLPFDGTSLESRPLGGAETAFVGLAEGFAEIGFGVTAFTAGAKAFLHNGVDWRPIGGDLPDKADLYIANRGHRVLDRVRRARRTLFWIHNPARYLLKWRYARRLVIRRPMMVFLGPHHLATYPAWAPGGKRVVLPLGLGAPFLQRWPERPPPEPVVIFTSSPRRGLDRLLDIWEREIRPAVPAAELHLYSGVSTYGGVPDERVAALFARADSLRSKGVRVLEPVPKSALAGALRNARVMAYGGDAGETFCLAVAEAQSVGLPAVVGASGAVAERVRDGVTGFVAEPADFAGRIIQLLLDDALWLRQHRAALVEQRGAAWPDIAARFAQAAGLRDCPGRSDTCGVLERG